MSKTLYIYDPTKHDYHTNIVADDYALQENETFTQPVGADGAGIKLPVSFDGKWIEATDDEHKEYLAANLESNAPTGSSDTDKAISDLVKSNSRQMALNAQLIKQITELQTVKANTTQEVK